MLLSFDISIFATTIRYRSFPDTLGYFRSELGEINDTKLHKSLIIRDERFHIGVVNSLYRSY